MFVPDMWGHEIFNLEPTVGVQAMYTTVTGDAPGAGPAARAARPRVALEPAVTPDT